MRMCVSICIRTSLLFYIPTHLSPCSYVCMFRLFCNDPLYPMYSNCYTSLCTCSERLGPMLTQLWLHVQGSVFQYSSISMLPINTHIPCSDQKCSILWTPTPHQDPFLFKNRLLGLAHFLAGKMISFFQILIFSYPPFRLVYKPKNRGNSTGAGLTPFRRKTFLRTKPRFRAIFAGEHSFPICSTGSKALKTSEDPVFLGNCTTNPCWYKRCAESSLLLPGTNHECRQKQIDGIFWRVIINFSKKKIFFWIIENIYWYDMMLRLV